MYLELLPSFLLCINFAVRDSASLCFVKYRSDHVYIRMKKVPGQYRWGRGPFDGFHNVNLAAYSNMVTRSRTHPEVVQKWFCKILMRSVFVISKQVLHLQLRRRISPIKCTRSDRNTGFMLILLLKKCLHIDEVLCERSDSCGVFNHVNCSH